MKPLLAALLALATLPMAAQANDRHFTYTYESGTLPEGNRELELWVTHRNGREERYSRFDNRLELEYGLTDRLQAAFYLDTSATVAGEEASKTSSYEFSGTAYELKYKLSDPTADALGSAVYFEIGYGPESLELEAKLILDKRMGAWLLAGNLVLEQEWEDFGGENESEQVGELDLGFAHFVTEHASVGLESRTHAVRAEGELEAVAFFVGPAVSWMGKGMFVALTALYQVGAAGGELTGFEQDLAHHEKVNVRLLMGFDL